MRAVPRTSELAQKSPVLVQVWRSTVWYDEGMSVLHRSPATLAEELSDERLLGLCRLAVNGPVLAGHLPTGIAEPSPAELAVLVAEVGRRTVTGPMPETSLDARPPRRQRSTKGAPCASRPLAPPQPRRQSPRRLPDAAGRQRPPRAPNDDDAPLRRVSGPYERWRPFRQMTLRQSQSGPMLAST